MVLQYYLLCNLINRVSIVCPVYQDLHKNYEKIQESN